MYIHIFDAHSEDRYVVKDAETAHSDDSTTSTREYIIQLFGATAEGAPVQIDVTGFRPFLFVSLPNCRTASDEQRWKSRIVAQLTKVTGGFDATLVKRGLLYGYTGGKQFPFLQLSVSNMSAFFSLKKALLTDTQTPKMIVDGHTLEVYESNIDPMLRFFHMRSINPCGWISIDDIESEDDDIHIECAWTDINPCAEPPAPVAPFRQVIWDIECDSFDGSFPVAKQGYRRVAKQLWSLCETAEEVLTTLTAAFLDTMNGTTLCPVKIPPLKKPLRMMPPVPPSLLTLCTKLWSKKDSSAKEKEECIQALTTALDFAFSRTGIAGDPIIQIGSVLVDGPNVSRHIFVLGTCDPIHGVVVHSFKDEATLLQEWLAWLLDSRVDIFVGYNTNCFDEKYVWERLEELGLSNESYVQQLSRLYVDSDERERTYVKLEEKKLASSALGDNTLFIWTTPGRLRIDLLGHIRRKAQLPSYKLDSVCAVYLSGVLKGITSLGDGKWLLKTKEKKERFRGAQAFIPIFCRGRGGCALNAVIEFLLFFGGKGEIHVLNARNGRGALNDAAQRVKGTMNKKLRKDGLETLFPGICGGSGNAKKGKKTGDISKRIDEGSSCHRPTKGGFDFAGIECNHAVCIANFVCLV